jgi:YCII-related domain
MPDFIFLMHNDAPDERGDEWAAYLSGLEASGHLRGGSAIGGGVCARKHGADRPLTAHLSGFIRVEAAGLEEAKQLIEGNPVYEAGGTVEIRELPNTD